MGVKLKVESKYVSNVWEVGMGLDGVVVVLRLVG